MRRLAALPVRWKLALTSAGLTMAILLLFAIVIGAFTARHMRSNFDRELRDTSRDLQTYIRENSVGSSVSPSAGVNPDVVKALNAVATGDAALRLFDAGGRVIQPRGRGPDLGPPRQVITNARGYRVVSGPVAIGTPPRLIYVQYGKSTGALNGTIGRVRLFLLLGVLGGTALALLAGLAVARRAMSPIASLTRAAREIARTRDPARRLPRSPAEDEVAELSRTLEEMLVALDQARGETEATLERQREFVADASHELRTPLTSVLVNLELLQDDLQGEGAEIADSALRSSRRMRRLVADLLLLARADAGRESPRQPTDLGAVLRDAAAEAAVVAADHELSVDAPPGVVVVGAADELQRMARNLIENAVTHTPAGTGVEARIRREAEWVTLEVSDDGPGIPAELGERVFERFVRAGRDGGAIGSGLGLAIVRAVAESHGGSVALESPPGLGARFVVRLPVAADVAPAAAAPHDVPAAGGS